MRRQAVGQVVAAVSLVTIAALTLYPAPGTATAGWRCVVCGTRGTADLLLNVLLFAPLGAGLALAGVRHRNAFVIAAFVSGGIELAQVFIPGRDASLGDLIANCAGCGLGFLLLATARLWLHPTESLARRLALGAALATAAVILLTGAMLQPQFTDSTYYGQWTPRLRHLERYRGTVLEATVGNLPLPSGRVASTSTIVGLLRRGSPIHVQAVAGPPTDRVSALFSIADADRNMIVLFGPRGNDLYYTFRMRAESFRLDRPTLIARDAMAVAVGDTIGITAWREGPGYCVAVDEDRECNMGFTVGSGWALLQYAERSPPWMQSCLDVIWMCLLLLPFGYWVRPGTHSAVGGLILVAALLLVPVATGLLATPVWEWAGAVVGMTLGYSVRMLVSHMHAPGQVVQLRGASC
jgi:hypothetical protein